MYVVVMPNIIYQHLNNLSKNDASKLCSYGSSAPEAYSLLLETLGKSDEMYQEFFDIQAMSEKHEYLTDFNMNNPHEMAKTMAVYSGFTEGVQLFSSFCYTSKLSKT